MVYYTKIHWPARGDDGVAQEAISGNTRATASPPNPNTCAICLPSTTCWSFSTAPLNHPDGATGYRIE
jgi:hypothetical protein